MVYLCDDREIAVLVDHLPNVWNTKTELLERALADTCELCGSREDVEVHHVRALKDLRRKGRVEMPEWAKWMAARHRKTLVVCRTCHMDVQRGHLRRRSTISMQSRQAQGTRLSLQSEMGTIDV